jgi:hypothetical protein
MMFGNTTSFSKYRTPLNKLHELWIKEVGCDIKFVDNWYCFYKFILHDRELVDVFFRCNIITGMLVMK